MPNRLTPHLWCLPVLTCLFVTPAASDACHRQRVVVYFAPPAVAAPEKAPEADPLKIGDGFELLLKLKAEGVQIYACKPKKDNPKEYEWVLTAPDAKLFDEAGKEVGKHFAGPSWQTDGGKV